jgi:hypothetical protein
MEMDGQNSPGFLRRCMQEPDPVNEIFQVAYHLMKNVQMVGTREKPEIPVLIYRHEGTEDLSNLPDFW